MIPPILFIDEKPFWGSDNKAIIALEQLKSRLRKNGDISLVEFFFENNNEFPFDFKSMQFQEVVEGREFIIIHNSYPHTKDRTLFPLQIIQEMKKVLINKSIVIRFSGQMYRRGYDDQQCKEFLRDNLKIEQPLVEKDLMIERDDVYLNLDKFIKQWILSNKIPDYYILKYGVKANIGRADEIKVRMKSVCWESYFKEDRPTLSLISAVESNKRKIDNRISKKRLIRNWKQYLLSDFNSICDVANIGEDQKNYLLSDIMSESVSYNAYFEYIDNIIKDNINQIDI